LGRSHRRELRSRLAGIIEHLLKLEHSPAMERASAGSRRSAGSGVKSSACLKTARVSEANSIRRSRRSGTARRGSSPKFWRNAASCKPIHPFRSSRPTAWSSCSAPGFPIGLHASDRSLSDLSGLLNPGDLIGADRLQQTQEAMARRMELCGRLSV
jgi:hypothetical protein